jgi:glc operon protein GlcG
MNVVAGGRNAILGLRGATPLEAGVPLVMDGKIIGAVGVSGELSGQDAQAAKACADNLGK